MPEPPPATPRHAHRIPEPPTATLEPSIALSTLHHAYNPLPPPPPSTLWSPSSFPLSSLLPGSRDSLPTDPFPSNPQKEKSLSPGWGWLVSTLVVMLPVPPDWPMPRLWRHSKLPHWPTCFIDISTVHRLSSSSHCLPRTLVYTHLDTHTRTYTRTHTHRHSLSFSVSLSFLHAIAWRNEWHTRVARSSLVFSTCSVSFFFRYFSLFPSDLPFPVSRLFLVRFSLRVFLVSLSLSLSLSVSRWKYDT